MPTASITREEFLSNLRQSGLVSAPELASVVVGLRTESSGRAIARGLVGRRLLTKFQAELLLAGRTDGFFLGQYKILDQLGQGGMGRVYKAVHQTLHRVVALKMLAPRVVNTAKARKLFLREVRAAGQLSHPNIVTAYDANKLDGRHFLVLEYVDGPNLSEFVREHGPLPVGLACEIVRQTAVGLQYAHERGMVHRDIKPSNLLIERVEKTRTPLVKILDFGLARLHEPHKQDGSDSVLTQANIIMGTPDFLSPEQARGLHNADIRSDLYSLGCTFYYLLTGRVPFPGGTSLQKLLRHGTEEPSPVEQDVPAPVLAILRRLLAKKPEDRFQTPADLAAALMPYADPVVPFWTEDAGRDRDALGDNDELAALVGTLPDMSLTSPSGESLPGSDPSPARLWIALALATGIVSLLIGLLVAVL